MTAGSSLLLAEDLVAQLDAHFCSVSHAFRLLQVLQMSVLSNINVAATLSHNIVMHLISALYISETAASHNCPH